MTVLVDTPIWSLLLRRQAYDLTVHQRTQLQALKEIVAEGRARLLGAVRQELLSGVRSSQQFARLQKALRFFPDVRLEIEDYETAAEIGNACRVHGVAGAPSTFCCAPLRYVAVGPFTLPTATSSITPSTLLSCFFPNQLSFRSFHATGAYWIASNVSSSARSAPPRNAARFCFTACTSLLGPRWRFSRTSFITASMPYSSSR